MSSSVPSSYSEARKRQTSVSNRGIWEGRSDEESSKLMPLLVDRVVMQNRQVAEVTILPALGNVLRIPRMRFADRVN